MPTRNSIPHRPARSLQARAWTVDCIFFRHLPYGKAEGVRDITSWFHEGSLRPDDRVLGRQIAHTHLEDFVPDLAISSGVRRADETMEELLGFMPSVQMVYLQSLGRIIKEPWAITTQVAALQGRELQTGEEFFALAPMLSLAHGAHVVAGVQAAILKKTFKAGKPVSKVLVVGHNPSMSSAMHLMEGTPYRELQKGDGFRFNMQFDLDATPFVTGYTDFQMLEVPKSETAAN